MTCWGVPDWRDKSLYPTPDSWMPRWKWEFVRRREDVRAAWLKGDANSLFFKLGVGGDPREESPGQVYWKTREFVAVEYENGWISPNEIESFPVASKGPHTVRIGFDLDEPLAAQIETARRCLQEMQKDLHGSQAQRRIHREKWPLYLRVLDARDAGETWETIGRELLGRDPDAVSEDLPVEEFDRLVSRTGNVAAASARQVWEQARDLMFNFPD